MLSKVGYLFERYLRRRERARPGDLTRLRAPSTPGLVSIVLPVFNGEDYLNEALDSVLAQRWRDWELIAVDDGSTDATPAILDDYARRDPRIVAVHQANKKLPGALNAGFARARGEFLTWTSADNRLRPEFLEILAAELRARPGVDLVYADYDLVDESGRPLRGSAWCVPFQKPPGSEHIHIIHDVSILNIVDGNYLGAAFLYRDRAAHLLGEYSSRFFTCEDYDFFMRANEHLTVRHARSTEILYEYRLHGASLTANKDGYKREDRTRELMVFDDFRRDFAFHPIAWRITHASDERSMALQARLRELAARAGHILIPEAAAPNNDNELFHPAIDLSISSDLGELSSSKTPLPLPARTALNAFLYTGREALPARVSETWDLCLAAAPGADLPTLPAWRQGWYGCDDPQTIFAMLALRALTLQEEAIGAAIAKEPTAPPPLQASVVICTYKRSERLRAALRAACRQSVPHDRYEVVVVNNNPGEDLSELVESCRLETGETPPHVRLIPSPFKGLSFARNTGLAASRGEVVAFLDDDAIADPDWLEHLLEAYAGDASLGVVGGTIRLRPPEPLPRWYQPDFAKFWSDFTPAGSGLRVASDWTEFPYGANWSARREALLRCGGFRIAYGRRGGDTGAGEETLAAISIQRLGYKIAVLPEAAVLHDVDPARFTLRNLWRIIMAGYRVRLEMQTGFYIPASQSTTGLLRHATNRLRSAIMPLRQPLPDRIEKIFFGLGALRAAALSFGIQLARLRPPHFRV